MQLGTSPAVAGDPGHTIPLWDDGLEDEQQTRHRSPGEALEPLVGGAGRPPEVARFRATVLAFEAALAQHPDAVRGESAQFPLKHSFADGVYVREIFLPKGAVLTGKIHKHAHPNFLMQGEVIVVTESGGREHLRAPLAMMSQPGTKRAIVALEDTVWITVHVTQETDLARIEDEVIAKDYEALEAYRAALMAAPPALEETTL